MTARRLAGHSQLTAVDDTTGAPDPKVRMQAVLVGNVDCEVRVLRPLAGPGTGRLAISVGPVSLVIADLPALLAFDRAWQHVRQMTSTAFTTHH